MELTPYKKEDIFRQPGSGYLHEILDEFCNSGLDCVKVEGWTHRTASSCQSVLRTAINRYNKHGVKCITKNGEVYLIKTE